MQSRTDNLLKFPSLNPNVSIALQPGCKDADVCVIAIAGTSLEPLGLYADDLLIVDQRARTKNGDLCIVDIIPTNERLARFIYADENNVILKAADNSVDDLRYHSNDVQLVGLVISYQRSLKGIRLPALNNDCILDDDMLV